MTTNVYAGIDIGSASVRAATLDEHGTLLTVAEHGINKVEYANAPGFVTQDAFEIWKAVKFCLKSAVEELKAQIPDFQVDGISCAATCSLVVMKLSSSGTDLLEPYSVAPDKSNPSSNVVMWMDKRGNYSETLGFSHPRLGGAFNPEMAIPKICSIIESAGDIQVSKLRFFDLHDFISFMLCTNNRIETEGFSFDYHHLDDNEIGMGIDGSLKGFSKELLASFGLKCIAANDFQMVGRVEKRLKHKEHLPIPYAGCRIGKVNPDLAQEIGIRSTEKSHETYVGHGVIDSYGGWLSTSAAFPVQDGLASVVAGTSTCVIMTRSDSKSIEVGPKDGLWGPFLELDKGLGVYEGGQAAAGLLIDQIIKCHPAYPELQSIMASHNTNAFQALEYVIEHYSTLHKNNFHYLTRNMFLYGDVAGNRTPLNDPQMTGSFIGMGTDNTLFDLASRYITGLEFLALQLWDIMRNFEVEKVVVSGSFAKNRRYLGLLAIIGKSIGHFSVFESHHSKHEVARGAALLGRCASLSCNSIGESLISLMKADKTIAFPVEEVESWEQTARILRAKYEIMLNMMESQRTYRHMIASSLENPF
ncbi:unnamed protein product [Kuraishia capsulata CBS 1993]|uniref:Carbohydrate kinase FGGY C-terminal domain-containing protein n=1 Tax=Kuraishia capsulata CBS 1993 TaxID=1382522 RepID=W6MP72_9ASCO|nr:uncharacterized protein KUCA_T00004044001 [Kuraishia capsulata CBS 1993]CDK28063.1 unnamed protein product [Kuraishia capsulata CBS 1993]